MINKIIKITLLYSEIAMCPLFLKVLLTEALLENRLFCVTIRRTADSLFADLSFELS